MSLFNELKRRNVIRVALAYGVLSWLMLQVADVLVDALELPAIWSKGIIGLLVIGFIPTLVFSWVYELTPEGVKRESEIDREQSIAPDTGRKLNIAVIVMLGLAIALFAADRFVGRSEVPATPTAAETSAAPAAEATEENAGVPVVAVLPLQALSTEEEGRFLASGLHDDLLTRLARLEAFRVISRTSVMEYAQTTKNLKQIAQELGAGYIVEGGLQAIGGRVRINAQLIDAATDEHLWAETFERSLTPANLFEVQGEIAAAIARATHATLSPQDVAVLETVPTDNLAAYQAFLKGLELFGDLSKPAMYGSLSHFKKATELDPEYADAWAYRSAAHLRLYWEEGGEVGLAPDPAQRDAALRALERAEALEPDGLDTLIARAYYHYYGFRDYSSALIVLGRVEAMAPNHVTVIALRGYLLRRLGRMDEAADVLNQTWQMEPNSAGFHREAMATLVRADRCDESNEVRRVSLERFPDSNGILDLSSWVELACNRNIQKAVELARRMQPTTLTEIESKFLYLLRGDRREALGFLENLDESFLNDPVVSMIANSYRAWLLRQLGDDTAAGGALAAAQQAAGRIGEISYGVQARRAFLAALAGDADTAREYGMMALDSMPADALNEYGIRYQVAMALATAGLTDEAIGQLEILQSQSGRADFGLVEIDPFFASLEADPRFARLLATEPEG